MIANARMYSVSPEAAGLWRRLLATLIERAGLDIELIEHTEPKPIEDLWARPDKAAVFMCGLPFSQSQPRPTLIAAPVPAPADFQGQPRYWSEMVVRVDSGIHTLADSFGRRLALTVAGSQSGYVAALSLLRTVVDGGAGGALPLYAEVIEPQITPVGALTAVVEGRADIAPIDAYAFCLLQLYRRDLTSQVRIIARTPPTAIPVLVGSQPGLEKLQEAFLEANERAASAELMAELLLERFVRPSVEDYDALQRNDAEQGRYWSARPLAARIDARFPLKGTA
jgi:ABC-type phosphate/phosphonate transport system substrate-binding protein